ncbi:MAG TPA: ElyC/SanA/YdcF family protein [Planosporangium sp.]|jgi:vancomycin permeability regulator SanA|nr:ElyC/SanA/YdcF family protein [Planosporangium sp.]
MGAPKPHDDGPAPVRPSRWLHRLRWLLPLALGLALLLLAPTAWLRLTSAGHVHDGVDAAQAPVVIVFGAQLAPGGSAPKLFLRGRLDTAAEVVRAGRARAVLVSGDAHGGSGDEVAVMSRYLVGQGVPQRRIVLDGYGLDSYDTCRRAHDVYGVRRALLVSQAFHLPRAVSLCRGLGIDADGVAARCDDCRARTLQQNKAREIPAAWKALYDRVSDRPPAVSSPANPQIAAALRD